MSRRAYSVFKKSLIGCKYKKFGQLERIETFESQGYRIWI
ncbi:hypothetical protein A343_0491 [Porphyromonas gingivalis JCVI SC001]|nr:hypothetical protein A343_0491 [Porphyromonas gingivalis JCVI SC001]